MPAHHQGVGCQCGAYSTTIAGYRQMHPDARRRFQRNVRKCSTCARDRAARAAANQHGHAQA